jgi:hypothetical protein
MKKQCQEKSLDTRIFFWSEMQGVTVVKEIAAVFTEVNFVVHGSSDG